MGQGENSNKKIRVKNRVELETINRHLLHNLVQLQVIVIIQVILLINHSSSNKPREIKAGITIKINLKTSVVAVGIKITIVKVSMRLPNNKPVNTGKEITRIKMLNHRRNWN